MTTHDIICADARKWMQEAIKAGANFTAVITSLPDAEETGMNITNWRTWFVECVAMCCRLSKTYAIFYQTDRKADGGIESKSSLVFQGGTNAGMKPIWHKIALRRGVGKVDLFRPGFTHLICLGHPGKTGGKATPDVIEAGEMIYPNAMGMNAANAAMRFIASNVTDPKTAHILDPFCGKGTIPALAAAYGFSATGIDILPEQCEYASKITLTL